MHIDILFVAMDGDLAAVNALHTLQGMQFPTKILRESESAEPKSVAIFTLNEDMLKTYGRKNLVTSSHKLMEHRPKWAMATPFVWGIGNALETLEHAVQYAANRLDKWLKGEVDSPAPWLDEGVQVQNTKLDTWRQEVDRLINIPERQNGFKKTKISNKSVERGGEVAYRVLTQTGRVLTEQRDLHKVSGALALAKVTGHLQMCSLYGTSDLCNVFEMLQVLKMAAVLNTPAVFVNYPSAHNYAYWRQGFLEPSLQLLAEAANLHTLNQIADDTNYFDQLDPNIFASVLERNGIQEARDLVEGHSLTEIYTNVMRKVAAQFNAVLGLNQSLSFTTVEAVLQTMGDWEKGLAEYAHEVQQETKYPVVIANMPGGQQFRSNKQLPNISISELHTQGGWLGGAALYRLFFRLGESGNIAIMIKDSRAGKVNMLALPYMQEQAHLFVVPAGLFRMCALGQHEDWSIDPFVFLELTRRWGLEKFSSVARQIWNAMSIPMPEEEIGQKTVVTVSLNGIDVAATK